MSHEKTHFLYHKFTNFWAPSPNAALSTNDWYRQNHPKKIKISETLYLYVRIYNTFVVYAWLYHFIAAFPFFSATKLLWSVTEQKKRFHISAYMNQHIMFSSVFLFHLMFLFRFFFCVKFVFCKMISVFDNREKKYHFGSIDHFKRRAW